MSRAVFLDRDNTLIRSDSLTGDPGRVQLMQGAASAIASLRGLGYRIVVVTNQPSVAQGEQDESDIDALHSHIADTVRRITGATIDRFYYCPYHPQGTVEKYSREHPWRKPAPGMILQAAKDLNLDLSECWTVGDELEDVEAGAAAGTRTILLGASPAPKGDVKPDFTAANLVEAARTIAQKRPPETERIIPILRSAEPAFAQSAADESGSSESTHSVSSLAVAQVSDSIDAVEDPSPPRVTAPARPLTSGLAAPLKPVHIDISRPDTRTQIKTSPPIAPDPLEVPRDDDTVDLDPSDAPGAPDTPDTPDAPDISVSMDASESPDDLETSLQSASAIVELLSQIHRELRVQRADFDDFSWTRMIAVILQIFVLGCALFAGFSLAEPVSFFQWITAGLLSQLTVIALLLFRDRK